MAGLKTISPAAIKLSDFLNPKNKTMNKLSKQTNFAFLFITLSVLIAGGTGFISTELCYMIIIFSIVAYCLLVAFFTVLDRIDANRKSYTGDSFYNKSSIDIEDLQGGTRYICHHVPTMENWVILGISKDRQRVCCAGWPPSIADMSNCTNFEYSGELNLDEISYRNKQFGHDWL